MRILERTEPPSGAALLFEVEFHHLRRFFRRWFELPFLDRILAGLNKDWVAAQGATRFHAAVGSDDDFDFDFAGDIHAASKLWQCRRYLCFYFAPTLFDGGLRGKRQRDDEQCRSSRGQ